MATIVRNLDKISSGYPVFEKDQVLTADQLNQVSQYLDDAGRLTRTELLGVGIFYGLFPSVSADLARISRGVAVTTDGDLIRIPTDIVFATAKPYDPASPGYGLFVHDEVNIAAFELVAQGTVDAKAFGLADFQAKTGLALADTAAILVMESSLKSQDMCSGTDCDNLGQCLVDDLKVLLIDKNAAATLLENVATPDGAARKLDDIVVERVKLAGVTTTNELVKRYRDACTSLTDQLGTALANLFPACGPLLGDAMSSDPAPSWIKKLAAISTDFENGAGIQYHYDFLKDVASTYASLRETLFGDKSVCCPDVDAFPKYVLLGNVTGDTAQNRTGCYPSRHTRAEAPALDHVKFLLNKLNAQITSFLLPAGADLPLRITPSNGEDQALEERAIPFYYRPDGPIAIHQNWSYALHQRDMDAWNYGYHAAQFAARGGAAKPLTSDIGRFDFFRIEGHLGAPVAATQSALEREIAQQCLPLCVRSVMLGADKAKIFRDPKRRYTDLHRLHDLARFALADQLDDAVNFTDSFRQKVDFAVANNVVKGDDLQATPQLTVSQVAAERSNTIRAAATGASASLRQKYSAYQQAPQWRGLYDQTQQAAGDLKQSLGKVAKNEFTTPIDTVLGSVHVQWIDWLDRIIKAKDDSAADKLLFTTYHDLHPGLEHRAGVTRGGTFVLVYDEANAVVADFMLPYRVDDVDSPQDEPPPPPKPPRVWPNFFFEQGTTVRPSVEATVIGGIDKFWLNEKPKIESKITTQRDLLNFGVQLVDTAFKGQTKPGIAGPLVKDDLLGAQLDALNAKNLVVQKLNEKLIQGGLTAEQEKALKEQINGAEKDVAMSATSVAAHVKTMGSSLEPGGDGIVAMTHVGAAVGSIRNAGVVAELKNNLGALGQGAAGPFGRVVGAIIKP